MNMLFALVNLILSDRHCLAASIALLYQIFLRTSSAVFLAVDVLICQCLTVRRCLEKRCI